MDVLTTLANNVAIIAPASGLTGGAFLAVFLYLIRSEKLWFDKQHKAVVAEKDKQIEQAESAHSREMTSKDESHAREMKAKDDELIRTREDRDTYMHAGDLSRERADTIQSKVFETVVPTLQGVDHALTELNRQAEARKEAADAVS